MAAPLTVVFRVPSKEVSGLIPRPGNYYRDFIFEILRFLNSEIVSRVRSGYRSVST